MYRELWNEEGLRYDLAGQAMAKNAPSIGWNMGMNYLCKLLHNSLQNWYDYITLPLFSTTLIASRDGNDIWNQKIMTFCNY